MTLNKNIKLSLSFFLIGLQETWPSFIESNR